MRQRKITLDWLKTNYAGSGRNLGRTHKTLEIILAEPAGPGAGTGHAPEKDMILAEPAGPANETVATSNGSASVGYSPLRNRLIVPAITVAQVTAIYN